MRTTISFLAAVVFVISLISFIFSAPAHGTLIDDFNDGNDDGWTRLENLGAGVPGVWDATSGEYNLASTGQTGPIDDFIASVWNNSADPMFSNGFLRAKVRANTPTSVAWLAMRFDGVGGIYEFAASPRTHTFEIYRILPGDIQTLATLDDPSMKFNQGEDWIFEAGAVGDQISFKVWRSGDPEPAAPQMTATDSTFAAGPFGVGADTSNSSPTAELLDVTFDDVLFTVPEPATWLMALMGSTCLLITRRWRTQ